MSACGPKRGEYQHSGAVRMQKTMQLQGHVAQIIQRTLKVIRVYS